MNERTGSLGIICLVSVVCVLISDTLRAATLNWTNTAGGDWTVAENWEPNQGPQSGDTATITNSGNYTVTVTNSAAVDSVQLGNGGSGPALTLAGSYLACSGTVSVQAGATLGISQAMLQAGEVDMAGSMN